MTGKLSQEEYKQAEYNIEVRNRIWERNWKERREKTGTQTAFFEVSVSFEVGLDCSNLEVEQQGSGFSTSVLSL